MNINFPAIKYTLGATALTGVLVFSAPSKSMAQSQPPQDTFVKTGVSPQGVSDSTILAFAPSPDIKIRGVAQKAKIVVDINNNILYLYNNNGKAVNAFSVATGKESTPTHRGIRVVGYIETYPYENAGRWTKRRKYPDSFGPNILHLYTVDPDTGARGDNGEYIHGNNNPESIGQKVSHGCMRLDNDVAAALSEIVHSGDFVLVVK